MDKKRSAGVTVLAIFHFLCAVITVIPALFLGLPDNPYGRGPAAGLPLRIFLVINPLYFLVSGIGIMTLKNWARVLTAIVSPIESVMVFLMIIDVLILSKGQGVPVIIMYLPIAVLFASICYYLTRPKVKELFGRETGKGNKDGIK